MTNAMSWRGLAALAGLAGLVAAGPLPAQDGPAAAEAEIVERILDLKRQIDELLTQLPPERRADIEKKLAELAASEPAAPVAAAPEPAPEAAVPESVATVSPPAPAPAPPSAAPPPPPRRYRTRIVCNTLEAFDTNGDGMVDAMDRYWRYLYLWIDKNGNGQQEEREVVRPFDRKVGGVDADLDTFDTLKGGLGDIRVIDRVVLDLRGNGFSPERSGDDAVLVVDASALKRRDGPQLLSAAGEELEGYQLFVRGLRLRSADGTVTRLNCP